MYHRRSTPGILAITALAAIAVALAGTPVEAQAGAKVLTPPRPADTATRTATRPATTTVTSATAPVVTRPGGPVAQPAPATGAPTIPQSALLDSIRELVFRNLLEKDRAGFATLASAFCLGLSTNDFKKPSATIDRADPPEAMVRRLASPRTPARRASTCTFSANASPTRSVTGRSLLYSVGAISMTSSERAEAAAGFNYDGYSAGGFTFSVERSDSAWVVKQWRMEWTAKPNAP